MGTPPICAIACMAKNHVIGDKNQMIWHIPEDLKHFKNLTMGKPIIMGRKTYLDLGKALPGRTNIVLTTQPDLELDDALVCHTTEEALALASKEDPSEIMITGGGEIYRLFMPYYDKLYLTLLDKDVAGETTFPEWPQEEFVITDQRASSDANFNYEFITYERV